MKIFDLTYGTPLHFFVDQFFDDCGIEFHGYFTPVLLDAIFLLIREAHFYGTEN